MFTTNSKHIHLFYWNEHISMWLNRDRLYETIPVTALLFFFLKEPEIVSVAMVNKIGKLCLNLLVTVKFNLKI